MDRIKGKIKKCKRITYNEPHVTIKCMQRLYTKEEIENHLRNPANLVGAEFQKKYNSNEKYNLYFKISNTKTLKLPVIFKKENLYILTVIVRYRKWQKMLRQIKKRF